MPGGGAALHEAVVDGDVRRGGAAPIRGDEQQPEFLLRRGKTRGLERRVPRDLHDLLGHG